MGEKESGDMVLYQGLDSALLGYTQDDIAVYDYEMMVEAFMKHNDWERQDAVDWIDYNIVNAKLGKKTPHILYHFQEDLH